MATRIVTSLLLTAAVLASASARSLRMPAERFASLDTMSADVGAEEAVRNARHAMDFAEFDQPLSAGPVPVRHHRSPRDAGAEEACDCADNPDLIPEIVDSAPTLEDFPEEVAVESESPRPSVAYSVVEAPEELPNAELTADDVKLNDDLEATIGEGGLDSLREPSAEAKAEGSDEKAAVAKAEEKVKAKSEAKTEKKAESVSKTKSKTESKIKEKAETADGKAKAEATAEEDAEGTSASAKASA